MTHLRRSAISVLSRVISVTASPVTRRAFQSTALVVEENTTFGMSRQRRANSICAGVALALVFHEAWLLSGAPKRKNAPELG